MSNYTGAVPETRRKTDWRLSAACRTEDPELFFPTGSEGGWKYVIVEAKKVCARCPVRESCLRFALDERIGDGIFGGLTDKERAAFRRRIVAAKTASPAAAASPKPSTPMLRPQPKPKPQSLRAAWNLYARPFTNDHITWHGPESISFKGHVYRARRLSYILDRGHDPDGSVRATCGLSTCVNPRHLGDDAERTGSTKAAA